MKPNVQVRSFELRVKFPRAIYHDDCVAEDTPVGGHGAVDRLRDPNHGSIPYVHDDFRHLRWCRQGMLGMSSVDI